MSNRWPVTWSGGKRLPLRYVCPQFARVSTFLVPPVFLGWESFGLVIGLNSQPAARCCFTDPYSPARPNVSGEFTAPNNEVLINWSAGGWLTPPVSGSFFAVANSGGPFITTPEPVYFYDYSGTLYGRVNARVVELPERFTPLVPYSAPTWPVWLARGLGASMHIPGLSYVSTLDYANLQAQYTWGLTDGMIVHPDDQKEVGTWVVIPGGIFPVSLKVPFTATNREIGDAVNDAYCGVNADGVTRVARGLVVDLSSWMPQSVGSMKVKGFAIRS